MNALADPTALQLADVALSGFLGLDHKVVLA